MFQLIFMCITNPYLVKLVNIRVYLAGKEEE